MKTVFAILVSVVVCFGQITIDSSDFNITPGYTKVFGVLEDSIEIPALFGANQVWDFSNLVADKFDTVTQVDTSFDLGDLASYVGDYNSIERGSNSAGVYIFKNLTHNGIKFCGITDVKDGEISFNIININSGAIGFPLNYGSNSFDTSLLVYSYGATVDTGQAFTLIDSTRVDGYGTLILPNDTFEVIRLRTCNRIFSKDREDGSVSLFQISVGFTWYAKNIGDVASISKNVVTPNFISMDTAITIFDRFRYLKSSYHVNIESENMLNKRFKLPQINIFPNPANSLASMNISGNNLKDVALSIYGINGKLVNQLFSNKDINGSQTSFWNGRDYKGNVVGSGAYVVNMDYFDGSNSRRVAKVFNLVDN